MGAILAPLFHVGVWRIIRVISSNCGVLTHVVADVAGDVAHDIGHRLAGGRARQPAAAPGRTRRILVQRLGYPSV